VRYYIIPARAGSKGIPHKNRKLFKYTADIIPEPWQKDTIVTTDDPVIIKQSRKYNFLTHIRPKELAEDGADPRTALQDVVTTRHLEPTDEIVMLYLTYPTRTFEDIGWAYQFYKDNDADSLLCSEPVKTHPSLAMYDNGNNKGEQVISHDLYQRQQYPKCFEISHFIAIMSVEALMTKVNKNLYYTDTIYYPMDRVLDIDYPVDLDNFLNQ
jgi:CMP-N,N'-diacetyllegionaminic acid synthase